MLGEKHQIRFVPNPTQRNFIESRAEADLFVSRLGEGKSTGLVWACFYHTKHNPKARWAIVRDTWTNMERSTQKEFFEWFPPGIAGHYKQQNKTFTWAPGLAEGEVLFLGLDNPDDASKIQSVPLGGMAIDEAAPAVGSTGISEHVFDVGMMRLRQPEMKWYAMKVAENNPDEDHWTYRRFVSPGTKQFRFWQTGAPENLLNLPADYYAKLRANLAHRPDLIRRFVEGQFGFQQEGQAVTPQWDDRRHLALGLAPSVGSEVVLLWDFGHNPTCIFTQKTPLGHWHILDALVGDGIGVEELIGDAVKPLLAQRYKRLALRHIGDPAGNQREQTSIHRSAVRLIQRELGGPWQAGPVRFEERVEPLRSVLHRGNVKVDRERAKAVWHALRGGWHFRVPRSGVPALTPIKNVHSHPGDAMSYGAAVLFPMGRLSEGRSPGEARRPSWFKGSAPGGLVIGTPGLLMPKEGSTLDLRTVHGQGNDYGG